jgi:hypothetical protein
MEIGGEDPGPGQRKTRPIAPHEALPQGREREHARGRGQGLHEEEGVRILPQPEHGSDEVVEEGQVIREDVFPQNRAEGGLTVSHEPMALIEEAQVPRAASELPMPVRGLEKEDRDGDEKEG